VVSVFLIDSSDAIFVLMKDYERPSIGSKKALYLLDLI
jgi:hypothetical protein